MVVVEEEEAAVTAGELGMLASKTAELLKESAQGSPQLPTLFQSSFSSLSSYYSLCSVLPASASSSSTTTTSLLLLVHWFILEEEEEEEEDLCCLLLHLLFTPPRSLHHLRINLLRRGSKI